MDIPSIDTLRNDAIFYNELKEKKDKDIKKQRLKSILEKRKNSRNQWSLEHKESWEQYLKKLNIAHNNYVKSLQNEIVFKTKLVLKENPAAEIFKLIQPQMIKSELGNIKPNEIYKGIWRKKKNLYDRYPHIEAGIENSPLIEVTNNMKKYGYIITDISDSERSDNTVIEIKLQNKITK